MAKSLWQVPVDWAECHTEPLVMQLPEEADQLPPQDRGTDPSLEPWGPSWTCLDRGPLEQLGRGGQEPGAHVHPWFKEWGPQRPDAGSSALFLLSTN